MKQKIQHSFLFLVAFGVVFMSKIGLASAATGWVLNNTYNLPNGSISGIIKNLMNWLLWSFAVFGVIGFIISGILYLTSAGNENQIDRAKTAMTYSALGVLVGISGIVVLQAVNLFLNADSSF